MKTAKHMTNNPKLWRCYWGNFDAERNAETITREIYRNRNKFALCYGLKPTAARIPMELHDLDNDSCEHDHEELYLTRDNRLILIVSNYNTGPHPLLGMTRTLDLYSTSCKTFIRKFSGLREFRQTIRAAAAARGQR